MKQLFTVILVVFASGCAAQVGFGPEIGVGMSTFKFVAPTSPFSYVAGPTKAILSGKIGGVIDVPMSKHTYFQAGLSLWRKGAERSFSYYHNDSFNEVVSQKLYINYFEVAVNLLYKTGMQGKGRFFIGIGATPSYIVGGHYTLKDNGVYNDTAFSFNEDKKIVTGKTLHGFDIGVALTAGYELPTGLYFRAYYSGGVSDIGIKTEVVKNRALGIAIGHMLGKGRNINKESDDLIDITP